MQRRSGFLEEVPWPNDLSRRGPARLQLLVVNLTPCRALARQGAPVAVKELSETTLDLASIGSSPLILKTWVASDGLGGFGKPASEHFICSLSSIVVKWRDFALAGRGVLRLLAVVPSSDRVVSTWHRHIGHW